MFKLSAHGWVGISLAFFSLLGIGLETLLLGIKPAFSQISDPIKCERNQESFGFKLKDWQVEHQGFATLNVEVNYRFDLNINSINPEAYPDFVPIAQDIQDFVVNYPNETDYWEIMNKKLGKFLMDKYPQISSLELKITVMPTTPRNRFERHSAITLTRPNSCPLTH